ncbi:MULTISPECIES: hypothetical protein [Novosphingobium]|mgnify:CR=1 FL=1|uniref:Uncharacterized protein n=1 Tax=Novosphingobium decolorationis TaxID=2698673 RepID=A0ABX8E8D3_9SPHN|nr:MULTISPECIES: hypothetical protein [Novosphingobium]QVM85267.1 hypothetical protein HT578_17625 [Novosphingobium decolorationis]GAM05088.1 hypothetical protein MBENS4_2086 [Novosphingobium sp. MBES04]
MALNYAFLIARADEASRDAQLAKLENVRERALRAEAAWREMAASALKLERNRKKTHQSLSES